MALGGAMYTQGQQAAVELASALEGGWRPDPMPASIALNAGESLLVAVDFRLAEFSEQHVQVSHSSLLAFGNPLFLVGSIAASAALNAARNNAARRAAAPQWRLVAHGVMHVTDLRLGLQTMLGWWDVAYPDIRSMICLDDGVAVFLDARPPLKLVVAWPEYLYVFLNFLAWQRIPRTEALPAVVPPT
ncbi:MAG TPA: hypothetical protein VFP61_04950 [Acidimicrobiales bacterium]|nr:hypothetical protein [Acidimicrobiales bacterium]